MQVVWRSFGWLLGGAAAGAGLFWQLGWPWAAGLVLGAAIGAAVGLV